MVKNMVALATVVLLMGAGQGWAREIVKKPDTKAKTQENEKKTTKSSKDPKKSADASEQSSDKKENTTNKSGDDGNPSKKTPSKTKDDKKASWVNKKGGLGAVRTLKGTSPSSVSKTITPLSEATVVTAPDSDQNAINNSIGGGETSTNTSSDGSYQESNTCKSGASPTIDSSLKKLSCNCPQGTYTFSKDYEITCETSKPNCSGNETLVQNSSTGIYTCGKKS